VANELPALAPDRLQVLVFGPGTGELVVVRAPPNDWMVIDPLTPGFPDCWVMLEVEKTGAPTIVHGRGSVVVTRG
jgi:hypothetical protein